MVILGRHLCSNYIAQSRSRVDPCFQTFLAASPVARPRTHCGLIGEMTPVTSRASPRRSRRPGGAKGARRRNPRQKHARAAGRRARGPRRRHQEILRKKVRFRFNRCPPTHTPATPLTFAPRPPSYQKQSRTETRYVIHNTPPPHGRGPPCTHTIMNTQLTSTGDALLARQTPPHSVPFITQLTALPCYPFAGENLCQVQPS